MLIPIVGMVRKDLQIFLSDRRAVLMAFVVPIAIASFFGSIFSGGGSTEAARIPVAIVDLDGSAISKAILAHASTDKNLVVTTPTGADARAGVGKGKITVAVVIPAGFGQSAGRRSSAAARSPFSIFSTTRRTAWRWRWCAASSRSTSWKR